MKRSFYLMLAITTSIYLFFVSPALGYWAGFITFMAAGINVLAGDDLSLVNHLLIITELFFVIQLASLVIYKYDLISYGQIIDSLFPWSVIACRCFVTAFCLVFGYIARYNMGQGAGLTIKNTSDSLSASLFYYPKDFSLISLPALVDIKYMNIGVDQSQSELTDKN
jgi:hypothetical protein